MIRQEGLDVQVLDARELVTHSMHAFCMNFATVNIYLEMYWNKVLSWYLSWHRLE